MSQKAKILGEQERLHLSNAELCRRYGIQNGQISKWKEGLERGQFTSKGKKSLHTGNPSQYAVHESAIHEYVIERRNIRAIVNVRAIIRKLGELCPGAAAKSYKSRQMWTYRFLARHRFSIRRTTRNVTLSDDEMDRRRVKFLREVEQRHRQYTNTIYVNMDQVSVVYGDAGRLTISERGATSVQARTGLSPVDRATVALSVASNGEKMAPMVIFRGTRNGRVAREFSRTTNPYPSDLYYMVNQNAWMTEEVMIEWINVVLMPFAYRRGTHRICLILDSFAVHRQDNVRMLLRDNGIAIIYIPGGMTAELQPLDVGVNAPFKHYIHEAMINNTTFEQSTASEKRHHISRSVSFAFSSITEDTVINSFNRALFTTYDEIEDAGEIDI